MPVTSPFGNIELPETDVWSFLFDRKDKDFADDKVIFQDGESEQRKSTFADVRQLSMDFGKGLKANFDVKKGTVIAVFSPNDIEFAPVAFGALWAGAVISPVNPGYTAAELAQQLRDCNAKCLLTQWSHIKTAREACNAIKMPESNIILMGPRKDISRTYKHWTGFSYFSHARNVAKPDISPKDDTAFIVYTSSSTGPPKGVHLTHYNITSNMSQIKATEFGPLNSSGSANKVKGVPDAPAEGDTMISFFPFFHTHGLTHMVHAPVYTGIKTIVMPQFGIEKWCNLVQQHKCTVAHIEPSVAVLLSKHPVVENYDLSSIRMAISGATPMSKELVEAVNKRTGLCIKQGYGRCETSSSIFAQKWEDWEEAADSTGVLLPNMEAKFCPAGCDRTKEVPAGEPGELCVRGPNIFKHYQNNKQATKECLDPEGWFYTGDIGYLDENGRLHITDQIKKMTKYKDFHVEPHTNTTTTDKTNSPTGPDSESETENPRAFIVQKDGLLTLETGEKMTAEWFPARVSDQKMKMNGIKFVDYEPRKLHWRF